MEQKKAQRSYARWAPLVTRREGTLFGRGKGDNPADDVPIADSRPMKAERPVQPPFRNMAWFQALVLGGLVMLFAVWLDHRPDRQELGARSSWLRFAPVQLDRRAFGALRLAGAWEVTSSDPRFGGLSALAIVGEQMIALSDSGAVIRFAKSGSGRRRATIGELPGGPGQPGFKYNRDSEALAAEPRGRGWWVAFENRDELWLYDARFGRVLQRVPLPAFPRNRGIEGATTSGALLMLAPEHGRSLIEWNEGSSRTVPIANPAGRIADLARLPSGELLVVNRKATFRGFTNSVALLARAGESYRYVAQLPLGAGVLDNIEAVAPELLPDGRVRLWLMSDDNHQRPLRTLLIAVDLPARQLVR